MEEGGGNREKNHKEEIVNEERGEGKENGNWWTKIQGSNKGV